MNCSTSRSRDGCAIRRCSSSRSSACSRTRRPTRSSRTSPVNGSTCANSINVQTEARNFDDNLRQSFRRETEMLFGTIVRDDRSLIDLLDADYTFVDERLARHYGIPNIHGSYFRRVPLPARQPAPRPARTRQHADGHLDRHAHLAGLARQVGAGEPARHAAASSRRPASRRTSEAPKPRRPSSLRQRLEAHRASPVCASCHRIMDPMGFALENFDLVGDLARIRRADADRFDRAACRRHAGERASRICDRPC